MLISADPHFFVQDSDPVFADSEDICVHVFEEPNVDLLRKKARVLEGENTRLIRRVEELLRENLRLKGMTPEQVVLNLPGLVAQAAGASTAGVTRAGSERRARSAGSSSSAASSEQSAEKMQQRGHGPTPQPSLPVIEETYDLDEADKICPTCGDALEEWEGHEDESEVIDVIERQWQVRKRKQKKYRCRRGCCMETAEAPAKLIPGGRYAPGVAVNAAVSKYLDQAPLDRQVRAARRQGVRLTTQALWDQVSALASLMTPVYERIKALLLSRPVIGVDESPFKLIKKGGSVKWQAWQMSCPVAVYFEILSAKSAEMGSRLLATYSGTVMVDGAATYKSLAKDGSFVLVNCWSHARRTVLGAEGEAPGQVAEFLDLVGELYAIERMAAREPEPGDERRGYRHRIDHEKLRALRDTSRARWWLASRSGFWIRSASRAGSSRRAWSTSPSDGRR